MNTKNELTQEQILQDFEWNNETQTATFKGIEKKTWTSERGYDYISIYNKGWKKSFRLHRLIALKYISNTNPEEYDQVDHLDGNKLNNRIENLRWCNQSTNMRSYYQNLIGKQSRIKKKTIRKEGDFTVTTTFDGYVYYSVSYKKQFVAKSLKDMGEYINRDTTTVRKYINNPNPEAHFIIKPEFTTTVEPTNLEEYRQKKMYVVTSTATDDVEFVGNVTETIEFFNNDKDYFATLLNDTQAFNAGLADNYDHNLMVSWR